jgi:hypothetical protein
VAEAPRIVKARAAIIESKLKFKSRHNERARALSQHRASINPFKRKQVHTLRAVGGGKLFCVWRKKIWLRIKMGRMTHAGLKEGCARYQETHLGHNAAILLIARSRELKICTFDSYLAIISRYLFGVIAQLANLSRLVAAQGHLFIHKIYAYNYVITYSDLSTCVRQCTSAGKCAHSVTKLMRCRVTSQGV